MVIQTVGNQTPSPAGSTTVPANALRLPVGQGTHPTDVAATPAHLKHAVESTNRVLKAFSTNVRFSVDEGTGKTIVRVVDTDTDELVRQIPSEETLAIARALDQLQGLIISADA
ncbi:MAG: flagellar protein FlaG [Burkholderiales bacterium]